MYVPSYLPLGALSPPGRLPSLSLKLGLSLRSFVDASAASLPAFALHAFFEQGELLRDAGVLKTPLDHSDVFFGYQDARMFVPRQARTGIR